MSTTIPFLAPATLCQHHTLRDKLINFQHRFLLPYDAMQPVASLTICLFSLFLLTYFVHRVAAVVQIPCPWIRSDEREYRRQLRPHSPSFLCAIPDCVTTCKPAVPWLSFLFSSSHFLSLTPRPHLPLPLLALALACPRPCPFSPSPLVTAIAAASSHQHTNVRHQHTSIYASPGPHLCILKSSGSWPFSLYLPLLSPGNIPELSTQAPFCITNWSPPQGVVYLLSVYQPQ